MLQSTTPIYWQAAPRALPRLHRSRACLSGLLAVALLLAFGTEVNGEEAPLKLESRSGSSIENMHVSAFVAVAALAYVETEFLRKCLDGHITPEPPIQEPIQLLRDFGSELNLAESDWGSSIPEFKPFRTGKPPFAALFVRAKKGDRPSLYVLAFRGSTTAIDWVINAGGFVGFVPSYYEQANRLTAALMKEIEKENVNLDEKKTGILVLAGHSLGGGMAEYAAARQGLVAVTFNSAHLSQPFVPHSQATIHTFHVTGKDWWNRTIFGDVVHLLRVGGNFEQTRLNSVHIGDGLPIKAHPIRRFFDWAKHTNEQRPLESGIKPGPKNPGIYRSEILRSMPNLIAEAPTLIRDSVRRKDVNRCDSFDEARDTELPEVWELRFRYGAIRDSYPAGGMPIENMRVLDPSTNARVPADFAETWTWESSLSHAWSKKWGWAASAGHRSLNYHHSALSDITATDGALGIVHVFTRGDLANKKATKVTTTLAATYRQFKAADENVGKLLGGELATSWEPGHRWLIWQDTNVSALRRAGVRGTNGTVADVNIGLRRFLGNDFATDPRWIVQARAFAGSRSAQDRRFANTQRGAGAGIALKIEKFRLFAEPSVRWTQHHVAAPGVTRFSDRETVLRMEVAIEPFTKSAFGSGWQIMGWEMAAGITLVNNQTAAGAGSYNRQMTALQVSKQY
jgi:hypothetical protein